MEQEESTIKIPKYRVLVVDDEEGVRKLIVTLLTKQGHQCLQAADGVDALEKVRANEIDAVITDVVMPRMDGVSLTKELSKLAPRLPIIVMTGYSNEFSSITAMSAGAREFIKKPFSITEFTLRFQNMMSHHESSAQNEAKQKEMLFQTQKKSVDEINHLKREIEKLKDKLV
jgi:DNA-binding NtrC family response regulator